MSQSVTVNVGGEPCKLVTIDELCVSYGKQSRPEWLSEDVPAQKKAKAEERLDAGSDALQEQHGSTTGEASVVPTSQTESASSVPVTTYEAVCTCDLCSDWSRCKSIRGTDACKCTLCEGERIHKALQEQELSAVETVSIGTELLCSEKLMSEYPTHFSFLFNDSKHLARKGDAEEAWELEYMITSRSYGLTWQESITPASYPLDDARFYEYRRYRPNCGTRPFPCTPLVSLLVTDDIERMRSSPWIRQVGANMMYDAKEEKSESVMLYNVHQSKWAVDMMERAMASRHCKHLQQYMCKKIPYMLEFDSNVFPLLEYNEVMTTRAVAMIAYCHFAGIGDSAGWELGQLRYIPSMVAGALPKDSYNLFADLGLGACHDVVQSGLWDVFPTELTKRELYAMMYKYLMFDEHPETCINIHRTVNVDDEFEDGSTLAADLPVDGYLSDKFKSCASFTNEQVVSKYLGNNDIFMGNFAALCKEWQATFVLAFVKNLSDTKEEEFADAEEVVHHATSLMVAWQTSVYGLIGCTACRLPVSHRYATEHWVCGCRVYDFIAYAVQEYVDSIEPMEHHHHLELTDADDYYKWIQRWMENKMASVLN